MSCINFATSQFIKDYARICEPLTRLSKKNQPFIWGEEQEEAFQSLKSALTSAPIIAYPDFKESFTLQTDVSDTGLGLVVTQIQNGEERVIAYASRILNKAERNYSKQRRSA